MSDRAIFKHEAYLMMAAVQSVFSKDPSAAVGAVLLDRNGVVKATGYNGFARGVGDDPDRYADRETKLMLARHAEANCLSFAGESARGGTLYSTAAPCAHCASAIVQAQVKTVVYPEPTPAFAERWADSLHWATVQFSEAGVEVVKVQMDVTAFQDSITQQRGLFFPLSRVVVKRLWMTTHSFPTQFQGFTDDMRPVYIRYRESTLRMEVENKVLYEGDPPDWVDSDGLIVYPAVREALYGVAVLPSTPDPPQPAPLYIIKLDN